MIVVPQPSSGWCHNYSTKTRKAGWANDQSIYSLMAMVSGCLRHSAVGQEGLFRARLQRRPRRAAVGLEGAEVRRHAHHHRLHPDSPHVLQKRRDAHRRAGGAPTGDLEK